MSAARKIIGAFTPGPWKVIKPGHGSPTQYLCVQLGADDMYTTLEMLPADARLISAAPEMLEALKLYQRARNRTGIPWHEVDDVVQRAIKKAEGQS